MISRRTSAAAVISAVWACGCVGVIGERDEGSAQSDEDAAALCGGEAPAVVPTPLRRLTRAQYDNTVRDLLGVTVDSSDLALLDEKTGPFHANHAVPVSAVGVEKYAAVAESLAANAALDALAPCASIASPTAADEASCAADLVESLGRRAFRRPLTAQEMERYSAVWSTVRQGYPLDESLRAVVSAMLQSPHFLYHVEPIEGAEPRAPLGDHVIASRLSYFLWDTMPDDELFSAADAGALADPEALRDQVERMLADDRARDSIEAFTLAWLDLARLDSAPKEPTDTVPDFDSVRAAMKQEAVDFVDYVIRRGDSRFATLLTASYSLPSAPLHALYGLEGAPAEPTEPVALDASRFSGVLTMPAWLAAHAHGDQTSPVLRGVAVREIYLCQPLPDPPPNVDASPPPLDPALTTRERVDQHKSDPVCASCHDLIDPIGLGLERYDQVGVYRDQENGLPIDDSGEIAQAGLEESAFRGAVELGQVLSQSPDAQACIAQQWVRFALRRPLLQEDSCALADIQAKATGDDGLRIADLVVAIVTSDSFRTHPTVPR